MTSGPHVWLGLLFHDPSDTEPRRRNAIPPISPSIRSADEVSRVVSITDMPCISDDFVAGSADTDPRGDGKEILR